MYVPRGLASTLTEALASFPSVLVTGPRQSGMELPGGIVALPWSGFPEWLGREEEGS